jgi:hypothetical protein
MAIAYQSLQSANSLTAGTALTITKPTGLAEGDLMIAFLFAGRNSNDWSTLTGWTKLGSTIDTDGTDSNLTVQMKIAEASDVAAANFSFTPHASHEEKYGAVVRLTGNFTPGISSLVQSRFDNDLAGTSPGGITPLGPNSILFMAVNTHTNALTSAYAVVNDNPTWTEIADGVIDTAVDLSYAIAYAAYTASGSTGVYSFTNSGGPGACLISINEREDKTVTPSVLDLTITVNTPTIGGSSTVSPSVLNLTITVNTPTITSDADGWSNSTRNTGTWTNQLKS